MNSKKQWTKDECINLIEMYRQHANLWESRNLDHKNRNKKQDSLKEFSNAFGTSTEEIERKIKNLVSQYKRERRNYKNMKKSGAGQSFVSKWFGYEAMGFLHDKDKRRKERECGLNLDSEGNDRPSDGSLNDIQSTIYDEKLDEECSRNPPEIFSHSSEEPFPSYDAHAAVRKHSFAVPKATTEKPKPTATSICQEVFDITKSVYYDRETKTNLTRDAYEVFGELVSRKLRSLKTNYAKATVQHLVNNILYDAELGKYDRPAPVHYSGTPTSSSYGSPLPVLIRCNESNSEIITSEEQQNQFKHKRRLRKDTN